MQQPPQIRSDLNCVYLYDANGSVGQLIAWAPELTPPPGEWSAGRLVATYEYDPYGGVTAQSGTYAAANPVRFSTKYWDDETGLGYWGYRYYSPALGRWINRDPIGEDGGENLYVFAKNSPSRSVDLYGLWAIDVHLGRTYQWARSVGYPLQAAQDIADACEAVDHGWTGPYPGQDQSYHFDRPLGGGDSRLDHFYDHFEKAVEACNWRRKHRDDPLEAARQLGTALHPLQDFVAHGDYGLAGSGFVWFPHNYVSLQTPLPGKPDLWKYPDDPDLDAIGAADGRPVGFALYHRRVMIGVMSFEADYAMYRSGNQRIRLTERMNRERLDMYRDIIEDIAGCECCKYFNLSAPN